MCTSRASLPASHAKDPTFTRSKLDLSASPQGENPPALSPVASFCRTSLLRSPASCLSCLRLRFLTVFSPCCLRSAFAPPPCPPSLSAASSLPASHLPVHLARLLLRRIFLAPVRSLYSHLRCALIRPLPAALHFIRLPPAASH
jgi:hypothetical protein